MDINGFSVKGAIDKATRCAHYRTKIDRIAIKFFCCQQYYSCYQCHQEVGCNEYKVWPQSLFDQQAILCGQCKSELTINEYLKCHHKCPLCEAAFNPGCSLHSHLYFAV